MTGMLYFFLPLVASLTGIYFFEKKSREKNFALGIDINKKSQNKTPEATGIVMLIVLWVAVIAVNFLEKTDIKIFYWMGIVTVFCLVGFVDDTRTKWIKKGIGWKERAIPIIFFCVLFGWLISGEIVSGALIGLFVAVFSSFHNSFAGLNGWEVGSSYIIAFFAAFLLIGTEFFAYSVVVLGIILGLLAFNFFPARVFPGDSGTLLMGSSITGLIALTMHKELIMLFALFYLPHLIDFLFLKMLTNSRDVTQAKERPYRILEDNRIGIPEYTGKTRYDFAKLLIKIFGPLKEKNVVIIIWAVVLLNCLFWIAVSGKIIP
ncbi:MAG: hypothetical protein ABH986_02500 [archaeon]